VQIGLMHDLGDHPGPAVLDSEALDERLERAVLAVVPELRSEHIEGDALARGVGGVGKGKLRVAIVEALDEPGGGDAIDVWPRPRHPRAAEGRQRASTASDRCAWMRFDASDALGYRLPERPRLHAEGRLEIVDGLDAVELPLEPIELRAEQSDMPALTRPV